MRSAHGMRHGRQHRPHHLTEDKAIMEESKSDGQMRRIRGGAMPHDLLHQERPFEEMQGARVNEKIMIGQAAANLVSHGETVILDVGTTTTAVARALVQRKDLYDVVIFTNALNIALALEPAIPRLSVVVI